ncbi:hypothetical protein Q0M94_02725 [Deinococcus radiomollis]|uniref:hypothetical protein n=1 Tax=Deinococcus radiomollis TaxID=468916 RepID=UPI0038914188
MDNDLDGQFELIKNRLIDMEKVPPFRFIWTETEMADEYMSSRCVFEGWTDHQIEELSERLGETLPIQFRTYLRHFGTSRGLLFVGSDVPNSIEEFANLKMECISLIRETQPRAVWIKGCIPFLMHQGYTVEYVSEDSYVWYWIEGEEWPMGSKKAPNHYWHI